MQGEMLARTAMELFDGMPDEYDPVHPNDYLEACKERSVEIEFARRGTSFEVAALCILLVSGASPILILLLSVVVSSLHMFI